MPGTDEDNKKCEVENVVKSYKSGVLGGSQKLIQPNDLQRVQKRIF